MNSKHKTISWDDLVDFETKDIAFKDQAYKLFTDELGFAPAHEACMYQQIMLRGSLRRFEAGEISSDNLEHHVKTYSQIIRGLIPKYAPHQISLLETQQAH